MVSPEKALRIYQLLVENGIRVWICGGWGIDALLGEHTRSHHDLDVLMLVDDVSRLVDLMERSGFSLKDYWEENRWTTDSTGRRVATAFFLHDAEADEFDAHALRLDEQGNGLPAWDVPEGFILTRADLSGEGTIAGVTVPCISAERQMRSHSGYTLPGKQIPDLERLHQKFGVDLPEEYYHQRPQTDTASASGG
jgi:lincosamide nucleotidyltransferase A/C/D/E